MVISPILFYGSNIIIFFKLVIYRLLGIYLWSLTQFQYTNVFSLLSMFIKTKHIATKQTPEATSICNYIYVQSDNNYTEVTMYLYITTHTYVWSY